MGKMTLQQMITQLAGGMAVSTQIFVITLLFSLPLGLVIAFGRMSKNKLIQTIVKVYISIMLMRHEPHQTQHKATSDSYPSTSSLPMSVRQEKPGNEYLSP